MPQQQPQIPKQIDPLLVFSCGAFTGAVIVAGYLPSTPLWLHLARPPIIAVFAFAPIFLRFLYRSYRAWRSQRAGGRAA
jgi:hypothetical protein